MAPRMYMPAAAASRVMAGRGLPFTDVPWSLWAIISFWSAGLAIAPRGVREAGGQGERLAFVGSPLHGLCETEVATWMALVRVIAALDEDLRRRLGAKQKVALLSDETLVKESLIESEMP